MDEEQVHATLTRAWERGIRYFDTAPHYGLGLSERRMGAVLAERPRADFIISTKVGRLIEPNAHPRERDDDGFDVPGDLTRRWDFSLDGVRRSLEDSLERLGLESVDILFAHDPDQFRPGAAAEGLAALHRLKDEGLVGAVGIGTNSVEGLREFFDGGLLDVVMLANRYSLLDQTGLESVLEPAAKAGAAVIPVGIFGTGLLSTSRLDPSATYDYRPADREVLQRADRIRSICHDHGVELPDAALAFPLQHPAVAAVAVGMRSPEEVDIDVRRLGVEVPGALWVDLVAEGLIPARSIPDQSAESGTGPA
jgi:D-threo-aldose 1-dehydrogenase